jgi:hypothetical protein
MSRTKVEDAASALAVTLALQVLNNYLQSNKDKAIITRYGVLYITGRQSDDVRAD